MEFDSTLRVLVPYITCLCVGFKGWWRGRRSAYYLAGLERQPQRPLFELGWRAVVSELQLARERLERQRSFAPPASVILFLPRLLAGEFFIPMSILLFPGIVGVDTRLILPYYGNSIAGGSCARINRVASHLIGIRFELGDAP